MKWCRIEDDGRASYAVVEGDDVFFVGSPPFAEAPKRMGRCCSFSEATLAVPVVPTNFYAAGLNYRAHVEWAATKKGLKVSLPAAADIGYRSVNALVPSGADIVIPKDSTGPVEFEGELVAVVGTRAKNLSEDEALGCLAGYTLGNDVSERTWQAKDRTLWRAKNSDTFKPMGPVVVTDLDPMALRIAVRINGTVVSEYETRNMIFSVQHYIARMSRYLTLYPGDVIWFGCDDATEPALQPGDVVEVVCDQIGVLRNRVVRER